MDLFVFYIGGSVPGAHLELHDIRFAVGESAEACWPALKAQWWGTPDSLHLDAWGALRWADGHGISLSANPPDDGARLFFVHLGGYDPAQFTELHHNLFIVASDAAAAKRKAIASAPAWQSLHKDATLDVDSVIDVGANLAGAGRQVAVHLLLRPDPTPVPFAFEAAYLPIGKMMR